MSRVQHGSPKKNQLIGAIQAGKNVVEAAELTQIPYTTAKKIWAKYQQTGTTSNRARSGRPAKLDERTTRKLVREARNNRRKPFREIGNSVEPRLGATTVRVHLAAKGYHHRVAQRVPYLKKEHKVKRKDWARFVEGADWSELIWSDKCYVYIGDKKGRVHVTRREDEEYDEDCLVPMATGTRQLRSCSEP
ncbi:hypothetical protein D9757_015520 [Collybiopsis confluens]|uniref:Transposase Tc1-like domain-containing protein n=1 Tax=Collybiopsis confluens TaxID=2823264 RepID=A0A8H5FJV6_9AGAR|nr:hypothetical protein D9757_015520 [Collybiopsis confluens]